jgi:trimethylamine:corrinoid methyltransferase-like protein
MIKLLSDGIVDEMISTACKLVTEKGMMTRNLELIEAAGKNELLQVKGNRIFPSVEALQTCLIHLKQNRISNANTYQHQHGWPDMLIDHQAADDLVFKLTDLPYQYCDHRAKQIFPLTRSHVIEGTKLMQALSVKQDLKGYTCGVPQDTADPLKTIEQYLIGFRYNQNGGGTIQSVAAEVESEFNEICCIAEGRENLQDRNLMLFSPSPMILDADDLYLCFKPGIRLGSFMVGSMPMMGMTGPVDPIGSYTLGIAEVLGAATILHALFPKAKAYIYPHPQAMDLNTGQMAFGTIEHARLEMLKLQVMKALGLPYYNLKDIMTSAQMPGSMAQGDKALGFYSGLMAGYKAFNLMSLSTDQVWSPVQALLDIEALKNAWAATRPINNPDAVSNAFNTICEVIDNDYLFGETVDTLMNMTENYDMNSFQKRYFSSEVWNAGGRKTELVAVEEKCNELLSEWNFHPDQMKLEKILNIYHRLCKKYNTDPIRLD